MDFSEIKLTKVQPKIRDRYIREVVILQGWLGLSIDVFQLDYFNDINIENIKNVLAQQHISNGRKSEYLRSVSAVLSDLYVPHRVYSDLMREYGKDKPEKPEQDVDIASIRTTLESILLRPNIPQALKIMCVMLQYNIHTDISSMLSSTLNDIEFWPKEACSVIRTMVTSVNQFGNGTNLKNVSREFKSLTGYTYSCLADKLHIKEQRNKPIIKLKHQNIQPSDGDELYSWDVLKMVQIHKDNIIRLSERLGYSGDKFNGTLYNTLNTLQLIQCINDLSNNTKLNYITALCVALDITAGLYYCEYTIYRMELELQIAKDNLHRSVPCFTELIKPIRRCYDDVSSNSSIRVLCLIILNNVTGEGSSLRVKNIITETGILRPSDLINTMFTDNGKNSYLSLDTKIWDIRKDFTKNKQQRVLQLDDDFISGINMIYENRLPQYLVVSKTGEQYNSSMSDMIYEYIGYNFDIIRASYFSWRSKMTKNREELIEVCHRQGHQYSTAMLNYNRTIDYSIVL